MKVLHILSELQFSGAELMLYTASDKFKKAGLDITILSTGKQVGIYADYYKALGWKVEHIPFRKHPSFFLKLYSLVKRSSFDVIHIHTEGAFIYKAFTVYMAGVRKIISTVHNNFLFNTYLTNRRRVHHYLALKFLDVKFTSISESVKETELSIYNTKTTLIYNWIDVDSFKEKRKTNNYLGNENTTITFPRFISVGKCIPIKNHMANFKLIKELIKKGINCHYTHIGCGELENAEKEWVKKNNLQQYVTFIDHTDKVGDYLAASDFYLMPSTCEGLGNACIEAMAAGLFCIVNDVPGLNELISHNNTGLIVDSDDIEKVAELVIEYCNNKPGYERVIRNAQQVVAKKYSLDNVDQLIEVYN